MIEPLGRGEPPSRAGVALPLLLVLLLALTLLAHGALLLAQQELRASESYLHVVRSSLAAEGAIQRVAGGASMLPGPRRNGEVIPLFSGWIDDALWHEGVLRWLGPEFFFLEGGGRSRGWPG